MRIAIDLTALSDNFSGIERYACEMAKAMLELGTKDSFILLFKDEVYPDYAKWADDGRVSMTVIPSKGRSKLVFSQLMLPLVLWKTKADVYLFMAFPAPVLFSSKRAVSTVHDLSCWDCPQTMTTKSRLLWRVLDGRAAAGHRLVITISEFSKERICDFYGKDSSEVTVAYCGIDRGLFDTGTGVGREAEVQQYYGLPERYVLSLSTIEPRKRLDLLVAAWSQLWDVGAIDYDLVLAGRKGWKMDKLLAGVSDGAQGHIHFTGFVEERDLPVLYRMSDAFVFPSRYEGFGLPPVEAHDSGARVLCSDIECLKEICDDKVAYFRDGDVADLERALTNPRLFDGVSAEPLEYSWDVEASKVLGLLKGIEETRR